MRYQIRLYVFPSADADSRAPVTRKTDSLAKFAEQIDATVNFTRSMVKFGDAYMVHIVCVTPTETHEIRIVSERGLVSEREFTWSTDDAGMRRHDYVNQIVTK